MHDVILTAPQFAKASLRNIPYRYAFLERRIASNKFKDRKKFRYGIPAYTGPFRALGVGGA
jgi:hypothetical protein